MSQTVSATEPKANLSPTLSESTVSKQSLIIGEVSLANFLRKSDIASEIESQTVRVKLGDLIDVDGTDDEVQQSTLLFQVDAEDQKFQISLPLNESTTRSLIKGKYLLASLIELERFDHVHL
ncbi:hypothetical protein, partial [Roseiconus lacunae]|uniref:hypothetical protein n=1 Tax=Roseiconus lacunae TaxID=2605694 RepID=UPI001E4CAEFE